MAFPSARSFGRGGGAVSVAYVGQSTVKTAEVNGRATKDEAHQRNNRTPTTG